MYLHTNVHPVHSAIYSVWVVETEFELVNSTTMVRSSFMGIMVTMSLVTLIASCATSYRKYGSGWMGGPGYSETRLNDSSYAVRFVANQNTRLERATDYCLLRAAELARENEAPFFVIVEKNEGHGEGTVTDVYYHEEHIVRYPIVDMTMVYSKKKPTVVKGRLFETAVIMEDIRKKWGIK